MRSENLKKGSTADLFVLSFPTLVLLRHETFLKLDAKVKQTS